MLFQLNSRFWKVSSSHPHPVFSLMQASLLDLEPRHSLPILQPQETFPAPLGGTRFFRGSWPHPFLGAGLVEGD